MTARQGVPARRPARGLLAVGVVAAAVLLGACGEDATTPTPTTASATPTTSGAAASTPPRAEAGGEFDPCVALTEGFLAEHQWDARAPERKQSTAGGHTWRGCAYLTRARYTFLVQTTDTTLDQVRRSFPTATEASFGGRRALRYEARPETPGGCTVNIETSAGSLYILVDDPRGAHPRNLSPCDSAAEIADAVAGLLPAGS
ncbi:DUF3558 domain-containing protein [Nocardia takedensis]|uniref:DUF3558 domain-containing protein n=1 Tax=Nocardia takedensis TaxID=259390 RepID=UPI0002ED4077|nr:DUF3558 domain-containing protein [Nocardia takedensis]